ncbi:MAG: 4-hydroxy-tetrahydrodipicolinate reductase [Planctomycetia bacterium]|nr:4-hydroxy-tetrahydrodipicolinate reductase [Planctomycetia bacterium]
MKEIKVGIHGAAGRMGGRLIVIGSQTPGIKLVAALDRAGHPHLGEDAGILAGIKKLEVPLSDTLPEEVNLDAMIDFSLPEGAMNILNLCVERKIPLVMATTGLNETQIARLHEAGKVIPIVFAPNMSLAVNVALKLAQTAAKVLAAHDADVEILERHHRYKVDSPSGTALKFGQLIAEEMEITEFRDGRSGVVGARPHNEIAYHAIRTGDNPGEHTVIFGMLGETIEVTVRCSSRDGYANGAYAAVKFLQGKQPGIYDMFDALELR